MINSLPNELLERVTPTELRTYASASGWTRVTSIKLDADVAVFEKTVLSDHGNQLEQIVIPQKTDFLDYSLRVAEVLESLAHSEKQPINYVLSEVIRPPSDIVRFRLTGPELEDGTVGLNDGLNLFQSAKKALVASACYVVEPARFHQKLRRAEAETFINNCRLGQTERGSFITTFYCPLNAVPEEDTTLPLLETKSEPFTRKVTKTLLGGTARLLQAIDEDNLDAILKSENDPVISANICDAIVTMEPPSDKAMLEISSQWAKKLGKPDDIPNQVKIRRDYFHVIEDIGRALRPHLPTAKKTFIGKVDNLLGKPGEDGRMAGDITVVFVSDDDELITAKISLSADEYQVAGQAHLGGSYVSMTGTLYRAARMSRIKDHRDFAVLGSSK